MNGGSGGSGGSHPRVLARQFAASLAQLRDSWELQYWQGGALPRTHRDAAAQPSTVPEPSALRSDEPARVVATAQPASPQRLPIVHPVTSDASGGGHLRDQAREWSPATKLEYLRRRNLGDCQRCGLARTRTNIVFGVGDPGAAIMFVGEAPGADEDRLGEPFVGRAGQRLDRWIEAIGLRRDEVYIANVLKCRPPGNRDPRPEEVDKCSPFLQAQIRAIAPKVIVALGRHAAMLLSRREDLSMKAMRGARMFYEVGGSGAAASPIPIVATYHPAYVLRQEGSEDRGESASTEQLVLQDLGRALDIVREHERVIPR